MASGKITTVKATDAPPTEEQVREVLADPSALALVFQPIFDLRRGVAAGFEALSRFGPDAPTPDRWFAAACTYGLAAELEALAISRALGVRRRLPPDTFLSINVSPCALLDAGVQRVLGRQHDLGGVVLEITEGQEIDDYAALGRVLEPLRDNGLAVAIDDAGAGWASLRHVTALHPQFVKVDHGLVAGVDRDPARAAAVETLGALASRIDAWVVAEGVETEAELRRLDQLHVPLAQGFALGRPGPSLTPVHLSADLRPAYVVEARPTGGTVERLVERVPVSPPGDLHVELTRRFVLDAEGNELVVLLDAHDRPTGLLDREAFLRGRSPGRSPLVVSPDAALGEVARRAMTRPSKRRFEPVICADTTGRVLGVVRIERLVEALAQAA